MFAFRLALALGYPHPDALLQTLSAAQMAEWEAYARLEPFGQPRSDYLAAFQACVLHNANRDPKHGKAVAIPDLLPELKRKPKPPLKPQTVKQQMNPFRRIAKILAARKGK